MNTILKTQNLHKKFPTTLALDNVNMTIKRGDIYGFIGENGAGKSTLIRVVTNVNTKTSGEVTLNVSKRPGSVAAVLEPTALHQRLNAMGNLKYQNELLNLGKSSSELEELLHLVGLTDQIKSKKQSRYYSLGMKQRLSIALAIISEPEFILLDEPMNGLDPVGIKEMRELILKLNHEQGVTFLISSHILSELDKIATVYGFISHGKLVKEISASALHASVVSGARIKLSAPLKANERALISKFTFKEDGEVLLFSSEEEGQKAMQTLIKADVVVKNFEVVRETIEDFYFKIINGANA